MSTSGRVNMPRLEKTPAIPVAQVSPYYRTAGAPSPNGSDAGPADAHFLLIARYGGAAGRNIADASIMRVCAAPRRPAWPRGGVQRWESAHFTGPNVEANQRRYPKNEYGRS